MSDFISASPLNSIQFERAEYEDKRPKCSACQKVLEQSYYHLTGHPICPECAETVRVRQESPNGAKLLRGLFYGLGMATACSAGYAIITLVTGMELALISILVGYLIGRATRQGAGGLGGRKLQVAAVLLTYGAITISYVPLLLKGAMEARHQKAVKVGKAGQPGAANVIAKPPVPLPKSAGRAVAGLILALAVGLGIAFVSPFLMLASGVSGILGIVILFFGLSRAWRETAGDRRPLIGPYVVAKEPAGG